jgi:hypothetical protein
VSPRAELDVLEKKNISFPCQDSKQDSSDTQFVV